MMMIRSVKRALVAATVVLGFAGIASADEIRAPVQAVDGQSVTVGGMRMSLPSTINPAAIQAGSLYDVSYAKVGDGFVVQQITREPSQRHHTSASNG